MNITEHAKRYAERGWHVFPVNGKQPLVRWMEQATTDPETIDRWWDTYPNAGIGISCGPSNLLVVDVDKPESLPDVEAVVGNIGQQSVVETGGGGIHIYFQSDHPVKNSVSKLADGVDIRANGGFVVAPPSVHESGNRYRWAQRVEPNPAPAPLIEALAKKKEQPTSAPTSGLTHERWAMAILAGEAAEVESAAVGTRNETLFRAACNVFGAVKGGHLDRALADIRLRQAAERIGLEADEVERTLDSAWQTTEPRSPETREPLPAVSTPTTRQNTMATLRTLTLDELAALPPPRWLLHNRIPEGQTWMYGEPGAGKTFLALDWAAAVAATGLPVVYCVGEGVQGFARRVLAIRAAHPGRNFSSLLVVPQTPHLMEPASVAALRQVVKENSPALLVVDTFARASVGADENSAKEVGMAIDVLDSLWHEYQCSSLVIHHSTKNSGTERGSSAIRGAADATWEVQAAAPGSVIGGQAVCRKMKDAEPPSPWLFQMRPSADSAVIYPSAIT